MLVNQTNTNPAVGDGPGDFNDIGYDASEDKLEQLVRSTDNWAAIALLNSLYRGMTGLY